MGGKASKHGDEQDFSRPVPTWSQDDVEKFLSEKVKLSWRSRRRLRGADGARLSELNEAGMLPEELSRGRFRKRSSQDEAALLSTALNATIAAGADAAGAPQEPVQACVTDSSGKCIKVSSSEAAVSTVAKAVVATSVAVKAAPKLADALHHLASSSLTPQQMQDTSHAIASVLGNLPPWLAPGMQLAVVVMQRATQARANKESCLSLALIVGRLADTLLRAPQAVLKAAETHVVVLEQVLQHAVDLVDRFSNQGWLKSWLSAPRDERLFKACHERLMSLIAILQLDLQIHKDDLISADGEDEAVRAELLKRAGVDPQAKDATDQAMRMLQSDPGLRDWLATRLGLQTTVLHGELEGIARDLRDIKEDLHLVVEQLSRPVDATSKMQKLVRLPPRNKNFVGRSDVLEAIASDLGAVGEAAISQTVVTGMGGVGKSQLAVEFAHSHIDRYDIVWWIPAEESFSAHLAFKELSQDLGLDLERDVLAQVLGYLRSHRNWLLIFDNAESPEAMEEFLPSFGAGGHVLITTRAGALWPSSLEVNTFGQDEALELLEGVTGRQKDESAAALVADLGNLPLAVGLAAAYIRRYHITFDEYQKRLNTTSGCKIMSWRPAGMERSMAASLKLSLDQLDAGALQWLKGAAFLEGDCIPACLMRDLVDDCEEAVISLADHSLVRVSAESRQEKGKWDVHRLVQRVVRSSVDADERIAILTKLLERLRFRGDPTKSDVAAMTDVLQMKPHTLRVMRWMLEVGIDCTDAAKELHRFAVTMLNGSLAIPYASLLLDQATKLHGDDSEQVAAALAKLGISLLINGDPRRARPHLERRLDIVREIHGNDHVEVYQALADLAQMHMETFDPWKAKELISSSLPHFQKAYGDCSEQVLLGSLTLARANFNLGEADQVVNFVNSFDATHPCAWGSFAHRAHILLCFTKYMQGDALAAKNIISQRIAVIEEAFGKEHFKVAISLGILVIIEFALGEVELAQQSLKRCWSILKDTQGGGCIPEMGFVMMVISRIAPKLGCSSCADTFTERARIALAESVFIGEPPESFFAELDPLVTEDLLLNPLPAYELIDRMRRTHLEISDVSEHVSCANPQEHEHPEEE